MAEVVATMAGTVLNILVQEGSSIEADEDVVVLESMKMEVPITAESGGVVAKVLVQVGDFVNEGDTLLQITEA